MYLYYKKSKKMQDSVTNQQLHMQTPRKMLGKYKDF